MKSDPPSSSFSCFPVGEILDFDAVLDRGNFKNWDVAFVWGLVCLAAFFATGYHHPDEYMQIIEFANAKLGGRPAESLTWEYAAQMRPWLQPGTFYVLVKCLAPWIQDPFLLISIYRLCLGTLGLCALVLFREKVLRAWSDLPSWIPQSALFLFFVPWLFTRHSSESLSASLLVIGSTLLLTKRGVTWAWTAGLILGLAFQARYQVALFVFGLVVACLLFEKRKVSDFLSGLVGFGFACALGFWIDVWGYGEPVFAAWNYFYQNVILDKASQWGVSPFWSYLGLMQSHPWFLLSLPMTALFGFAVVRNWRHPIVFGSLFFVLGHSVIGHKEMRFLFPILPFLPLFFASGRGGRFWDGLMRPRLFGFFRAFNIFALVVLCLWPSRPEVLLHREIWSRKNEISVLYVRDAHPYLLGDHPVEFVRPVGLEIRTDAPLRGGHWVVSKFGHATILSEEAVCRVEWQLFPAWVGRLNFGGWLERTGNWVLASCY